jgi:hypothetical protein
VPEQRSPAARSPAPAFMHAPLGRCAGRASAR